MRFITFEMMNIFIMVPVLLSNSIVTAMSPPSSSSSSSPFIHKIPSGGSTTSSSTSTTEKGINDSKYAEHSSVSSSSFSYEDEEEEGEETKKNDEMSSNNKQQEKEESSEMLFVTKRNGELEQLDPSKILRRMERLCIGLDSRFISPSSLTNSILQGIYPNVTTNEIDTLASETAASMSTQHPDYSRLAARICASALYKSTPNTFSQAIIQLNTNDNTDNNHGYMDSTLMQIIQRRHKDIDSRIVNQRDMNMTYFGFKTLERSYLLKTNHGIIIERPQYMFMRVALGIHCTNTNNNNNTNNHLETINEEDQRLEAAFETYDMMSRGYFTHASPTLFHAGTIHPQLSSCFLLQMSEDSINGIYDTLKRCAVISKAAGGIGLSVHNIRARGTYIRGTRGISNGLVPMLRVFDVTSRYVDQGGGKRPGAFAIYIEPWHADIFDILNLKKNHGKEEQRARDLFYGLWIPDLFMKRVEMDDIWSLMCPHQCPQLQNSYGSEFNTLYEQYEKEGKFIRQIRARELWNAIIDSQIETGTPYMLYKDSANMKSNQQNLGTIQCSNLCTEIIQYTDKEEVAVCNLASICLPKFVVSDRGPYGSTNPFTTSPSSSSSSNSCYFDHDLLHQITKVVTRNLNKIIDINKYPTPGAKKSNLRHRPIGIGVSGLADTFLRLGLPFASNEAKALNEAIFETIYHAALEASSELATGGDGSGNGDGNKSYDTFYGSPASKGRLQFHLWGVRNEDTPSHRLLSRSGSTSSTSTTISSQEEEQEDKNEDPDSGSSTTSSSTSSSSSLLSRCRQIQHYALNVIQNGGYDWNGLCQKIQTATKTTGGGGLRNSLLIAPMPTASTSQILGVNECFEPFVSNLYLRRVKAGEFIMVNPHLVHDLSNLGLWTSYIRNELMKNGGSISNIKEIPNELKVLYKTVWEMKMKDIIDMASDRGKFIDQSQSLNLFISDPTLDKLTAMHFYAWKKGLKTGMYYLRTRPAVNAIQYTVDRQDNPTTTITISNNNNNNKNNNHHEQNNNDDDDNNDDDYDDDVCLSCQA